ncbi:hypothetical protein [Halanaerobium kushneri]|uniref:Uncharacterized protein n=1 Tax=Halanaerobium kushneri TaxID=56779 RepID=A0A1N7BPA7_9FIRM|nr:hypothetical protein [Halanaerobium kushneri]SIR53096.1 hypothetical protein SAMN05421834_13316 [Halanaerobium kushneri]
MFNKTIILFWIFIYFIVIFSGNSFAAGVKPLVLNFDLKPGETSNFVLTLTPGSVRETIDLIPYYPTQNLSGGLNYELGDSTTHPFLNWIELEKDQIIVPPGQEQIVRGRINVPYNAAGSHTAVIMVEQVDNENMNSGLLNFKVRYAVRININIERPGQRSRAEITELGLGKNKDGNPQISAHIKNVSPLYFNASAEATIRDENNRLIERLNIVSKAAARANNLNTRIYPNSEVIFQADLNQPLYPGEYNLQVYLKYGDNRQLVERKNITLKEELRKAGPRRYISFEPKIISKNLRAGSPVTQVIEINNLYNKEIKVKINKEEVVDDFDYSIFNTGELQLRGGEELLFDSRSSGRLVFIYRSPRDAAAGGYYGKLELEVFDQKDELLETRNIDLEMLIGEDWKYDAEIDEFEFLNDDGVQTFSLNLKNLSSIHINPGVLLVLKNNEDLVMKTINLSPSEELDDKLLPEKTVKMIQRTTGIETGTYKMEIIITDNEKEIKRIMSSVDIN